jgi:arylsulfatase A-like enzyme
MPFVDKLVLERSLIAWAVGAFVGVCALSTEVVFGPVALTPARLGAYSLVGGVIAVVSRSVLASLVSAPAARAGALGAIAAFGSLHALYFINVRLLPSEHYLSPKSLIADAVVIIPLAAASLLLGGAHWAQAVRVRWGHAGAVVGAAGLVAGVAVVIVSLPRASAGGTRHGDGPDILLIVLDSLRADRLPSSSIHPSTPEFSKLARSGRLFSNAWAASSWTVPSVARILLATRPGEQPTLPERLVGRGYAAACFTDNPHLARGTQLLRGFDLVERSVGRWRSSLSGTAMGEVLERIVPGNDHDLVVQATTWLARQDGPSFLYIHLMDSHTPYRFPPLDGRHRRGRRIEFPSSGMSLTDEEADSIRARYDGGVHSADAQLGRLMDAVTRRKRPFLAVITSDHGESLGEDGRWFHGGSLAPELLAVPLLIVGSSLEPASVASRVGHSAISTTLLAAASVPCPDCSGADLRTSVSAQVVEGGLPPRWAYRVMGDYKLVLDRTTGQRRLYDLRSDLPEQHDIASTEPDIAERLAEGLAVDEQASRPSPEVLERLRSLGYAGH